MTEQEIFEKLLLAVQEVTGARADQITMESCLMEDLGAESIDLLDFTFLIEEQFGVTIGSDEFEQRAGENIDSESYERNGYLTDEALAELRKALPEVPAEKLKPGLKKIELPSVLNVAVFVHVIERKLAGAKEEAANVE